MKCGLDLLTESLSHFGPKAAADTSIHFCLKIGIDTRLLLGNAVLIWVGLFAASLAVPVALPVLSLPSLAYVPGYPVVLFVAELYFLLVSPLLNWWSRRLESGADRFALQLTRDPSAFAGAMRRLGCQNLIEFGPPRWSEVLLASHPALQRRIQLAETSSG